MALIYPSASFIYPNKSPASERLWGFLLSSPSPKKVPLSVPRVDKCSHCKARLIPQNGICPICEPENFIESISKVYSQDFVVITGSPKHPPSIVCLAFDLSLPIQFLRELSQSIFNESFLETIHGCRFIIVFLGALPMYLSQKNENLHFSFGSVYHNDTEFIFCENGLPSIINRAMSMIEQSGVTKEPSPEVISLFFKTISKIELRHLVLFHQVVIPPQTTQFQVHCICMTNPEDNSSFSIANHVTNGWNHCPVQNTRCQLNKYLSSILDPGIPKSCKMSMYVSDGFEYSWIAGQKSEKFLSSRYLETEIKNYSYDSVISVSCAPTSKFSNQKFFSIQIVCDFNDGTTYVSNRGFPKANTIQEWYDSLNLFTMTGIYMKQYSFYQLIDPSKNKWHIFDRKFSWCVFSLASSSNTSMFVTLSAKIFTHIISSDNNYLPLEIRNALLFYILTRGYHYIGDLVNALLSHRSGEHSIFIPPFIMYKGSAPQISSHLECKLSDIVSVMVKIKDSDFDRLDAYLGSGTMEK